MSDQHLIGTEGDDLLETAEGNDWLEGLGGNDTLTGNAGNDLLDGGSGQDLMSGGAGDDSYFVDDVGDVVLEDLAEGIDTVYSSVNRVLGANLEHLILLGSAQYGIGNELSNMIAGNDSYNDLEGGGGADSLYGYGGDDYLVGGEGDDHIDGGSGRDQMYGGAGDDLYIVDDETDWILENAGEGVDTVQSSATTFQLAEHIENLTLVGAAASATGNDSANIITGNDENNVIAGRGGDDTLIGGDGNDYIADFGDGNDLLDGGSGSDFLIGEGGDDVFLPGLGGQDTVHDSGGDDEVRMGAGVTPDQVERIRQDGSSHLILRIAGTADQVTLYNWFMDPAFQVERVVFDDGTVWTPAETGALRYFGTAGDDFLQGTGWDERIEGRGGNDQFAGWGGNDVYVLGDLGFDAVFDFAGDDEVRMPAGISPDQVERIRLDGQDNLLLRVAGQQLTLFNWFFDPGNQIERVVFDDGTVWTPAETGALRYFGTAGDDFLQGTGWDERIEGRGGNDQFAGWGGNDVYVLGDLGFDAVFDFGGDDEVRMPAGISPDQVERIRLDGQDNLLLRVAGQQLTLFNWFFDPGNQIERVVFDDGTVWTPAETGALRYFGTAGDDFLQGTGWDERIEGRGGNDQFAGWGGNDVYVLGDLGFDAVFDFAGDDEVRMPAGISPDQVERIRLDGQDNLLLRVAGQQLTLFNWFFDPGNQIERVVFDDGTVWTPAETGALRYFGTAGDDFLQGTGWDERIEGRGGNDQFAGWGGNDVYVLGDLGFDAVFDFGGDDEVRMPAGISPDQVERIRLDGQDNLLLRVAGQQLTLFNWFFDPGNQIERVVFDDGTVWTPAETGALRYFGTAGDDFLQGTGWDERIEGRGGNDQFAGWGGNDVYVLGDLGFDAVFDFGGDDEVRMPAGISPDQVERIRLDGQDNLLLRVAGQQLTLFNWFFDPGNQIERVVFDDGTVWTPAETGALRYFGTAGDDFLQGTGWDERIEGRGGNDQFAGWGGNDVYVLGDLGFDAVFDFAGDDEVRMPAGISPDQVERIRLDGQDNLLLRVAGQQLTLFNWFFDPGNQIERVVFDDGTVWTPAETGALRYFGTAGDDFLQGTGWDERIEGRGGNDQFAGWGGNDVYVLGDLGFDAVFDFGGDDEVRMPAGISPDQVERIRLDGQDNLLLRVAGQQLTLFNWFFDPSNQIERVVFDDGTVWTPAETGALRYFGTAGDDFLQGTQYGELLEGRNGFDLLNGNGGDDVLLGGAGGDTLHGDSGGPDVGNDYLDGGTGNDSLFGWRGSDTYYFDRLSGTDTVLELQADAGDIDTLLFGPDITPDDLIVTEDALGNLHIAISGSAAALRFNAWFNPEIPSHVERFEFHDGTVLSDAEIEALANDAPVVANPIADQISQEDVAFSFTVPADTFSDPDLGDVLAYAASLADGGALPAWLAFDPATRTFSGMHPDGSAGELTIRVTATDGDGLNASDDFVLSLVAERTFSGTEGDDMLTGTVGQDVIFGLGGHDFLFGVEGHDRLYGGDGSDWMVAHTGNDLLDGGGGRDDLFGGPGSDTYVFARGPGMDIAWELAAGDPGDIDTVAVASDIAPGDISVTYVPTSHPAWNDGGFILRISGTDESFKIIWSPTSAPEHEIEQVVFADGTVWDENVLAAKAIQNGTAPTLAAPLTDQSATEDAPFSFTVPAGAFDDADIFIGDSLAYSAALADGSALPSWLSFDAGTRTFSGTPANGDVGTISVRLTATDESGRSVADEFDFTVTNTNDAPTLASPIADQGARDTVAFSFTLPADAFVDVDAGDALAYSTNALPGWLSFNPATRTFLGTPGVADIGTNVNVELRATDGAGLWVSDVFAIAVGAAPDQTITGTAGNDTLNGGSGNDTINGLGGADSMSGGLGNDAYFVDNSGDQVIEAAGGGVDTVNSSITYTLGANVESLTLTGTANRNATGNALDNVLAGNSGSNTLTGLAGNDTYIVTQSNDNVVESSGNGTDTVRASISYTLGNNVEKLVLTGSGSINGTGNSLANSLTGNAGNNTLRGQGGADFLSGGAGNDILTGGSGTDEFYFGEAPGTGGVDHITDFSSGERLQFEEFVFTGLGAPGNFAPNDARFFAAPGASGGADASDRVVYNTTNGHLYYDADGSGAGAAALIAILDNEFLLSATNIGVL